MHTEKDYTALVCVSDEISARKRNDAIADGEQEEERSDEMLLAIDRWLLDKYTRTESICTVTAYRDVILSLRAYLHEQNVDLDQSAALLTPSIRTWAKLRKAGSKYRGSIAPATYNQRIATVSSFYQWAIAQGIYADTNPAMEVDRAQVKKYDNSRALSPQVICAKLKEIDCQTLQGLRDYVLLQVALNTGHSLRELASLTWKNVCVQNELVTLVFERCKGGKTLYDALDPRLSRVLLLYLQRVYGVQMKDLAPETPIWVSFSDRNYLQAIGPQTIADICEKRLGVSTVHTLRHTFALAMEQQGAHRRLIQERLGRASFSDTSIYLNSLKTYQTV